MSLDQSRARRATTRFPKAPDPARPEDVARRLQRRLRELEAAARDAADDDEAVSELFRPGPNLGVRAGEVPSGLIRRAGDRVGAYQLRRLVGRGAVGEVWEAYDPRTEVTVALKLVRPERMGPASRESFLHEARASMRIVSPWVVMTRSSGEEDGLCTIAQEYVEGGATLASFLSEARPDELSPHYGHRIGLFFYQLATALHTAHRAGVQHRDVKPANVLVTEEEGFPKLTDFGLARIREIESLHGPGSLEGTPGYMSPEQALGKAVGIDHRTDVFSFGACLMHAVTLEPPFGTGDPVEVLRRTLEAEPAGTPVVQDALFQDLHAIASKCLEKDPDDRYEDMRAVASDLENLLDGRPIDARPLSRFGRLVRTARRNRGTVAATLAAVLVLGLVGRSWWGAAEDRTRLQYDRDLARAEAHLRTGDFEKAHQGFRAVTERIPTQHAGFLDLALVDFLRGRVGAASDAAERARTVGFSPDAEVSGSDALEEARQHFERGVYLMVADGEPRVQEALESLEAAAALTPYDPLVWFALARAFDAGGQRERELEAYDRLLDVLREGDVYRELVQARVLECRGQLEEAREHLRAHEAALRAHDGARTQFDAALGRIAYDLDDIDLAHECLSRAAALDPESFNTQVILGLTEAKFMEDAILDLPVGERGTLVPDEQVRGRLAALRALAADLIALQPWERRALHLRAHAEYLHFRLYAEDDGRLAIEAAQGMGNGAAEVLQSRRIQARVHDTLARRYGDQDIRRAYSEFCLAVEIDPTLYEAAIHAADLGSVALEKGLDWAEDPAVSLRRVRGALPHLERARDVKGRAEEDLRTWFLRAGYLTLRSARLLRDSAAADEGIVLVEYALGLAGPEVASNNLNTVEALRLLPYERDKAFELSIELAARSQRAFGFDLETVERSEVRAFGLAEFEHLGRWVEERAAKASGAVPTVEESSSALPAADGGR